MVSLLEGMDDLLAELNELLHAIKMPVVAAGVLYYVQTLLLSEEKTGIVVLEVFNKAGSVDVIGASRTSVK